MDAVAGSYGLGFRVRVWGLRVYKVSVPIPRDCSNMLLSTAQEATNLGSQKHPAIGARAT